MRSFGWRWERARAAVLRRNFPMLHLCQAVSGHEGHKESCPGHPWCVRLSLQRKELFKLFFLPLVFWGVFQVKPRVSSRVWTARSISSPRISERDMRSINTRKKPKQIRWLAIRWVYQEIWICKTCSINQSNGIYVKTVSCEKSSSLKQTSRNKALL